MKAHKMAWYREWHQWRFSHHFHMAMLSLYLTVIVLSSVSALLPKNVLASTIYDWNLNTSSEYTYNAGEVQFTGGVVQPSREHYATDKAIYGTHCFDSSNCLFVGAEGVILKTTDGGATFSNKGVGLTSDDLNSISCTSSTTCYAVGGYH
ncbi:MAG: hypothetical protein AAB632_00760, partial [Patescibacteria group bacterium]